MLKGATDTYHEPRAKRLVKRHRRKRLTPAAYRKRFNVKRGSGASNRFLRDCKRYPYSRVAEIWGYKHRQRVQQVRRRMTDGAPKHSDGIRNRPDVTAENVIALAKRGLWKEAIARALHTRPETVTARLKGKRVTLPRYQPRLRRVRTDLSRAVLQHAAKTCWNRTEAKERLDTTFCTLGKRIDEYGVPFPRGRHRPGPEVLGQIKLLRRFLWLRQGDENGHRLGRRRTVQELAVRTGIAERKIYGWNERFGLGIPVKHPPRRRPRTRRVG